MNKRAIGSMQTREKLLEAGRRIISKKGLDNTCVEEITAEAEVSKGTFYTYFKKKEDIVFALSHSMFWEILEEAKETEGGFYQKLALYMTRFSAYIEQNGLKLAQEWIKGVLSPCSEGKADREKLQFDLCSISKLLEFCIHQGLLREDTPIDLLAHTLVEVLYGQLLCWSMSDGAYPYLRRTQEFCDTCLDALFQEYIA